MKKYSPFLKFKDGELKALFNLFQEDRDAIVPLIELPRDEKYSDVNVLIKKIDTCSDKMIKKFDSNFSFYVDNYEIPDKIRINGKHNYSYLIKSFNYFDIIPVIGFDRTEAHNDIGIDYANKKSKKIAFRITHDYFENFLAYKKDIESISKQINPDVSCDILIDCKYIENDTSIERYKINIIRIIDYFGNINGFSKIVISGSSIPGSINKIAITGTYVRINRNEVILFREIKNIFSKINLIFGDYTIVSPDYSEINIDPRAMYNVITPKIIYSNLDSQYISRGKKIRDHGLGQYFSQLEVIIKEPFFRKDNSWGDIFLYEKVRNKSTNVIPATIIAPTVNSHVKFMIDEIKKGST